MYYVITIMGLLLIAALAFRHFHQNRREDSPLKRRGILNMGEQLTLMRLRAILPQHTILAHVALDALLTTKFAHTRRKYQSLSADFVILDQHHRVIAIMEITDEVYTNRRQQKNYQSSLLEVAGYRVLRYRHIPTEQEIRDDLLMERVSADSTLSSPSATLAQAERLMKYHQI